MLDVAATLSAGLAHHRAGALASAACAYQLVLSEHPDQPSALYLYGLLAVAQDAFGDGEAMLTRAADLRPDHTESRLALANARQRRGDTAGAAALWREVLAIDPNHLGAILNLSQSYQAAGEWQHACELDQAALRRRPEQPRLWVALAGALLLGGVTQAAIEAADAAIALDFGLAEAWLLRGTALSRLGSHNQAEAALLHAAALDPGCARAALQLGNALIDRDRLAEAEPHVRRAISLDPLLWEAHSSLGFLLTCLGRLAEAIVSHDEAVRYAPLHAEAHGNRAATLLLAGDFPRGFAEYEWRKRNPSHAYMTWASDQPEWRGEPLDGRTILLFCEQGVGDTIMCARFIPVLAALGGRIVLVCPPALMRLLGNLPGIVGMVARAAPHERLRLAVGAQAPPYDTWIDQMSLPLALGVTVDAVPGAGGYLHADPALQRTGSTRQPAAMRVGLVWSGNPAHRNDRRRSMPVGCLSAILGLAGISFVSLQVGPAAEHAPGEIDRVLSDHDDYADTAAVIASLTLVIAVDTSVAHLAGALGCPVWLLLPYAAEWRWLAGREDTPWYRSMRLFRQQRPGDWNGVMARVAVALIAFSPLQAQSHARIA